MGNRDVEMQDKPSSDGDKEVAQEDDIKRPDPPKRDYQAQEQPMAPEADSKRQKTGSFLRPEVIYSPESTKSYMTCLKNLFILFNLLIWLFGAVLTGIGIWILVDEDFWDLQEGLGMKQYAMAGKVLIAAGVIIMLIGFFGCFGAFSQITWMLIVYAVVIGILILLEIAVMALVWTASNNKGIKEDIKSKVRKAVQDMNLDEGQRYFLNLMQVKLQCCGIVDSDEYETFGTEIPESCTNPQTGYPYERGCLDAVVKYLREKAAILGGIAVAVFVLEIGVIAITATLIVGLKHAASNSIF